MSRDRRGSGECKDRQLLLLSLLLPGGPLQGLPAIAGLPPNLLMAKHKFDSIRMSNLLSK